jgi:curved DNA-binding protein CbpA
MASKEALGLFLQSLERKSYYDILRLPRDASPTQLKSAFYHFSLLYHPDCHVRSPDGVSALAAEIYKRGVEAYRCLSRAASRERYDRVLERGGIRLESSLVELSPLAPEPRTLETIAATPRGKQHAVRADRLIAIGKLEEARVQLVSACQCEPYNGELADRLQALYEALALEPF